MKKLEIHFHGQVFVFRGKDTRDVIQQVVDQLQYDLSLMKSCEDED